ncbi:hypothetical protein P167DRAFT_547658 [Morchella conica CCBAS932]|uniref:Uncharacterized protein n=1 Tax=Morchella conica CCBAS932 TaxID=1392247 RepID=A0A3N4KKD8_9PEZI|nr:hypothetical protein P167DRAFT_547658 [Morchella conica CCBAS932]
MSTEPFTISTADIFTLLSNLSTSIRIPAPTPPTGNAPFRAPPAHTYPLPSFHTGLATPNMLIRRLAPPTPVYCPPAERTDERFRRLVARVWRIVIMLRRAKGSLRFVEVRELLGWAEGWMGMLEEEARGGEQKAVVEELVDGLWGVVEVWGGVRLAVRGQ